MFQFKSALPVVALVLFPSAIAFGFEDTKVMPKGIRRLHFRMVTTNIDSKTDENGNANPLAKPLEKALTFKDMLKGEKDPLKKSLAGAFLDYENFAPTESVGSFRGDLKGRVTVFAPIAMYGLTDRITLAAAMPIYNMAMSSNLGFEANATGQRFLNTLANPYNNQIPSARETGGKINNAVGQLNQKLVDNGYRPVGTWKTTGPGDLNLIAKTRVFDAQVVAGSLTGSVAVPTGRTDDPDNLLDKGFGDGQWDLALGATFDEPIFRTGLTANQFFRYTNQLPGQKTVRLITEEESIEVGKQKVTFKPGDKIETGTSVQFETALGFNGGVGYMLTDKQSDLYKAGASSAKLAENTNERAHEASVELGYSAVPAFKRGEVPVPFDTKFSYKRQLSSRNSAVTHFIQLDTGVFF
jgi:hypothetical protein